MKFFVVAPRGVKRLLREHRAEDLEWCYFGVDIWQKQRIAELLSQAKSLSMGEDLNRVAHDIKQPFLDWIADMGKRQTNQRKWWSSALASKSPLQSDFFLLVCYTHLVHFWRDANSSSIGRLLVIEDPWLSLVLRERFARDDHFVFHGLPLGDAILNAVYWIMRSPLCAAYHLVDSVWTMFFAKVLFGSNTIGSFVVCIYMWIEERSFVSPSKIKDPYTGRLVDILSKQGERVAGLTALTTPRRFLPKLKPLSSSFIIAPRFLRFVDIVRSLCSGFMVNDLADLSYFKSWNYRVLLYREILHEWGHRAFWRYRLCYLNTCRVAKDLHLNIKVVIYPFENQPWEKLFCLAWRHCAPHVRLIGYQHSSFGSLLLNYFLGKDEASSSPLPDCIVANGSFSLENLKRTGYPPNLLSDGGALRYEYLQDFKISDSRTERIENRRVLVALPSSWSHAASLLQDMLELFSIPLFLGNEARRVDFVLKCHPDLPLEKVMNKTLPEWFMNSDEVLRDLLGTVDVFLYTAPTTSWLEAYLSMLPVLKYYGDLLDIDSTDAVGQDITVCTKDTLKEKIEAILVSPKRCMEGNRQAFIRRVFSPVHEQTWAMLAK